MQVQDLEKQFSEMLADLPGAPENDTAEVQNFLRSSPEEGELADLVGRKRELVSIEQAWSKLPPLVDAKAHNEAQEMARKLGSELEVYQSGPGRALSESVGRLRAYFSDLRDPSATDPVDAWQIASEKVEQDIQASEAQLAASQKATQQINEIDQRLGQLRSRISTLEKQIAGFTVDAAGLGRALAELVPHLHGPDCPVCERDFREVSSEPLASKVSAAVTRLVEQSNRLKSLVAERSQAIMSITASERARVEPSTRALPPPRQFELRQHVTTLRAFALALKALKESSIRGSDLRRRHAEANGIAAQFQLRDAQATEIERRVREIAAAEEQPDFDSVQDVGHLIQHVLAAINVRLETIEGRRRRRAEARVCSLSISERRSTIARLENEAIDRRDRLSELEGPLKKATRTRLEARRVVRAAEEARMTIVSRVFNKRLNSIWRDLFVRLAPTEPFVPAFILPKGKRAPVSAELETVHRDGGSYGRPGAMLSAGNLNTAGLTLFIALHLAVRPRLPWLLLDDPVQSMDELHIAQFAGLLRTLAKAHNRQLVVAVHERPLFDYLCLELGASFPGDKLITVELGRSPQGDTRFEPHVLPFEPDRLVA